MLHGKRDFSNEIKVNNQLSLREIFIFSSSLQKEKSERFRLLKGFDAWGGFFIAEMEGTMWQALIVVSGF